MLVLDSIAPAGSMDPNSASVISYSACAQLPVESSCTSNAWARPPFEGFGPAMAPRSAYAPADIPIARGWTFDGPSRVCEGPAPSLSAITGFQPAPCAVSAGESAGASLPKGQAAEVVTIEETLLI